MARSSAKLEALTPQAREALEADIVGSDLSWRQLAAKYGVPRNTIHSWAERRGLIRDPSGLKRQLVQQALAKPVPDAGTGQVGTDGHSGHSSGRCPDAPVATVESLSPPTRAEVEAAAGEDARDLRLGLQASRAALVLVAKKLQAAQANTDLYAPREIKVLSEAVAINIGTIRTIRGLDALLKPDDLRSLSEDDLQAIAQGKTPRRP